MEEDEERGRKKAGSVQVEAIRIPKRKEEALVDDAHESPISISRRNTAVPRDTGLTDEMHAMPGNTCNTYADSNRAGTQTTQQWKPEDISHVN